MLGNNPYLNIHIITAYLSYLIFFIASAAAILFLIQNNAIKKKLSGIIFSRLPSLSFLDKLNYRGIGLGFPILTISILSGFIWAKNISGAYWWTYNTRQLSSLAIWLIYAVILHARLTARLRGRPVALLSLLAFFIIILSLLSTCH